MKQPLTFTSPLSSLDCTQRLETLAAQKHFYASARRLTTHIKIDSIETQSHGSTASFKMFFLCSPQRFELPAFVYFQLNGNLFPAGSETAIQLTLQVHRPLSTAEWILSIGWYVMLIVALAGGLLVIAASTTLVQSIFISSMLSLAGMGYSWMLYRTYTAGRTSIPGLVYHALQQETCSLDKGRLPDVPDWLASSYEIRS